MTSTIVGIYPHKLAAKHALAVAGYKRVREYGDFHFEYYKKNRHELRIMGLADGKWNIEESPK